MEKRVDAALLPEPLATRALDGGGRRIALPFDAVCTRDCLLLVWAARRDVDPDLAARFRVAVQKAARVGESTRSNYAASGAILASYETIEPELHREDGPYEVRDEAACCQGPALARRLPPSTASSPGRSPPRISSSNGGRASSASATASSSEMHAAPPRVPPRARGHRPAAVATPLTIRGSSGPTGARSCSASAAPSSVPASSHVARWLLRSPPADGARTRRRAGRASRSTS